MRRVRANPRGAEKALRINPLARSDGAAAPVESANVAGRIAKGAVVSAPSYRGFRIVPMLHRTQTF